MCYLVYHKGMWYALCAIGFWIYREAFVGEGVNFNHSLLIVCLVSLDVIESVTDPASPPRSAENETKGRVGRGVFFRVPSCYRKLFSHWLCHTLCLWLQERLQPAALNLNIFSPEKRLHGRKILKQKLWILLIIYVHLRHNRDVIALSLHMVYYNQDNSPPGANLRPSFVQNMRGNTTCWKYR